MVYSSLFRFIKVFWHMEKSHVKDRLGQNAILSLLHGDIKPVASEEATAGQGEAEDAEKVKEDKAQAILAIQKNQEQLQTKHDLIKKAEEQRKSAMVQQEGLLKSKHVRFIIYVCFILSMLLYKGFAGWFDSAAESFDCQAGERQGKCQA